MNRRGLCFVVLAALVVPVAGQRIDTETNDRTRIVHLKTALDHLTVIEVGEPVVQVAAGSPAFKVEWRENKVFVQPTEAEATTNLFIWTATQRLNYELEPAGSVADMDFAVDQAPATGLTPRTVGAIAPAPALPSMTELLLAAKPVRPQGSAQRADKLVEVWISDVYEKDGRVSIRYAVSNHGAQPYSISTPQVYQLNGVRSPQSLYTLVNSQLADSQVAKLKVKRQMPLQVLDGQLRSSQIGPGQEAIGVVTLQMSASAQPTVLRLQFPSVQGWKDGHQAQVAAFLVR